MLFTKDISHPNMFNSISGETTLEDKISAINQSIELILKTEKGELYGNPDFGGKLHSYFFRQIDSSLGPELKREIASWLNEQETRLYVSPDNVDIQYLYNKKTVAITITYNLRFSDYVTSYSILLNTDEEVSL